MRRGSFIGILICLQFMLPVLPSWGADPEGDIVTLDPVVVTESRDEAMKFDVDTPKFMKPPTPKPGGSRGAQPMGNSGVGAWVYLTVVVDETGTVSQVIPTRVMLYALSTRKGITPNLVKMMIKNRILPEQAGSWELDEVRRLLAERYAEAARTNQLEGKWNPGTVNGTPTPFRMSIIMLFGTGGTNGFARKGPEPPVPLASAKD